MHLSREVTPIAKPFIPWVGCKEGLMRYILQIIPPKIKSFIDVCGGSGAVILNLPPDPGRLDIYNDLDAELSNLMACAKERPIALMREIGFLPIHSRIIFEWFRDFVDHQDSVKQFAAEELELLSDQGCFTEEQAEELRPICLKKIELFDVKRAAAYYHRIRGSFSSTGTSFGVKSNDVRRFLYLISQASERLKNVVVENKNALQLIVERDREDSLIYADPPYYQAEKIYRIKCSSRFHIRLWQKLMACKGRFILSYNDCPFVRQLYKDCYILAFERGNPLAKEKGATYKELLITNYDPTPYMTSQMDLFSLGQEDKQALKLVHIPK
jgi:DNA adenine methylase